MLYVIRKKITLVTTMIAMIAICASIVGCEAEKETDSSEQYTIGIEYGSYTTARFFLWDLILPQANASVSELSMCFKRLRFKKAEEEDSLDPTLDDDNIDFNLGQVSVSSAGTYLGDIVLPAGEYTRLEFDLESDCAGGYSLMVTNNNGTFSTTDRITIKFEGLFTADSDGTLTLAVQDILNALNSFNGSERLKDAAEAISGNL